MCHAVVIRDTLNMAYHQGKTVKSDNSTTNWGEDIHVEHTKIPINKTKFNIFRIQWDLENFPKNFINLHFGFNIPLSISPTPTFTPHGWGPESDKHIVACRPVTR
jgi:hypothetical protein